MIIETMKKLIGNVTAVIVVLAIAAGTIVNVSWGADGRNMTIDELAKIEEYGLLEEEIDYTDPLWDQNKMVFIWGPGPKDTHCVPISVIETFPKYGVPEGYHMVYAPRGGQDLDHCIGFSDSKVMIKDFEDINYDKDQQLLSGDNFTTMHSIDYDDYIRYRDLLKSGNYIYTFENYLLLYDDVEQLIEILSIRASDGYDTLPVYSVPDKAVADAIADAINDGTIQYRSEQFGSLEVKDLEIGDATVSKLVDVDTALKNCGYDKSSSSSSDKEPAGENKEEAKENNEKENSSPADNTTGKDPEKKDETTEPKNPVKEENPAPDTDGHVHNHKSTVIDKATCTADGIMGWSCTCGDYYEEPILALGHEYVEQSIEAATCDASGKATYQCSVCGEKKEELLLATGHEWELTLHIDSTCDSEGINEYTCKNCGDTSAERIDLKEHVYVEVDKLLPSCIANGRIIYQCESCGDEYEEVIAKIEHKEETVVVEEASFFRDGLAKGICSECGEELGEEILPKTIPALLGIVLLVLGVAAVGGIGYIVFRRK